MRVLVLCVLVVALCGSAAAFETLEHTRIGNSFGLQMPGQAMPVPNVPLLQYTNGRKLTYGDVVAMAGDFYALPDAPISDGASYADRMARFERAFQSLVSANNAELVGILGTRVTEENTVESFIRRNKPTLEAYKKLGNTLNLIQNELTGGGKLFIPPGRYLKLAMVNWDHFQPHATKCYLVAHHRAMLKAQEARNAPDAEKTRLLKVAYAMNAYADHFLTDMYSTGHQRVPRKELNKVVMISALGDYLSKFQHGEDGKFGLRDSNQRGDDWTGYGDGNYLDQRIGAGVRNAVNEASRTSAQSIYEVFTGQRSVPARSTPLRKDQAAAMRLVPVPKPNEKGGNFAALFVWDGKKMWRRTKINDLRLYKYKPTWWGWSTFLALMTLYGPQGGPEPVQSMAAAGWTQRQIDLLYAHAMRDPDLAQYVLVEHSVTRQRKLVKKKFYFAAPEDVGEVLAPEHAERSGNIVPTDLTDEEVNAGRWDPVDFSHLPEDLLTSSAMHLRADYPTEGPNELTWEELKEVIAANAREMLEEAEQME